MKKTYNRTDSLLIAVRFPKDVHRLIAKRGKKGDTFSSKLHAAMRKLNELENQNGNL